MDYETIYDFSNESMQAGWMLTPILFVMIGYGIALFNIFYKNAKRRSYHIFFGIMFGSFALFFGIVTIPKHFSLYEDTKQICHLKNYSTVSGTVENFHPMPYGGHQNESFTVNDILFEYSDYDRSYYGFNNTKSHGGPIDKGKYVKLSYYTRKNKNIILKIEVPKE